MVWFSECASGVCTCNLNKFSSLQLIEQHKAFLRQLNILTDVCRANSIVLSRLNELSAEIEELLQSFLFRQLGLTDDEQVYLLARQHENRELLLKQEKTVALVEARMAFRSYQMDCVMFHIHLAWEEEQLRLYEELWCLDNGFPWRQ
jgi:hypothetical protein